MRRCSRRAILALCDAALAERLEAWRAQQTEAVAEAPRRSMSVSASPLPPGATIGILGGGQLGRMLALAAARLGFNATSTAPTRTAPPFDVARRVHQCRL